MHTLEVILFKQFEETLSKMGGIFIQLGKGVGKGLMRLLSASPVMMEPGL